MSRYGKNFLSHKGKAIRWDKLDDGTIYYLVAKGDGTDEFFSDWKDAMKWIDERKGARA